MKSLFLGLNIVLFVFLQLDIYAQSTTITPGNILPKVSTAERTSMTPDEGTLVFDSNTKSYWFYKNSAWKELGSGGTGGTSFWQLSGANGDEIKNTNDGGFWSSNPTGLSRNSDNLSNPPTAPISGAGTRLMWIPSRSAFRVGTVTNVRSAGSAKSWDADSIGLFSFAAGLNAKSTGSYSVSMGHDVTASDYWSVSLGSFNISSGFSSVTIGQSCNATNTNSIAFGVDNNATGVKSVAIGSNTDSEGQYSLSIGSSNKALGDQSTAIGINNEAVGINSFALGLGTKAIGSQSKAFGSFCIASGDNSTALGNRSDTNFKKGSFVVSDEPNSSIFTISLLADVDNRYLSRFKNGYKLFTSENYTTGLMALANANSWSSISDSTKKENFVPSKGESVLKSVSEMRVGTWNYKGQDAAKYRHWGVMAQDFYHHFGKDEYGTIGCDTMIATADFDGVSFAAIKALEERTRILQNENDELRAMMNLVMARIEELTEERYNNTIKQNLLSTKK